MIVVEELLGGGFVAVFDDFGEPLNHEPFGVVSAKLSLFTNTFRFAPTDLSPAVKGLTFFIHYR